MLKTMISLTGAAFALLLSSQAFADPGHGVFAAGEPGDPRKPARLIPLTMKESDGKMSYFPERVEVKRGEQVRFKLQNGGELAHEFVLDSFDNNTKHRAEMAKNPDMEHDSPNAKRLDTKKSNEVVWRFSKAGTFEFACLIPGHYEAGMKGVVVVK